VWLLREQHLLFGNYVPGLEVMPVPHPGGWQHYGAVARNFRRIQDWMESIGGALIEDK
jgi:hypothetical protein